MRTRTAYPIESWLPIPGWGGLYSVSNLGNVRIEVKRQNIRAGQHLQQATVKDSYLQVALSRDGTPTTVERHLVHRLVAMAFIGPIPEGYVVNHLDGDKQNNRRSNLEICTHQQNIHHAMRELGHRRDGAHNPAAKLTEADVLRIRERAAAGETHKAIAADYKLSGVMVGDIADGKAWKNVGGPRSTTKRSKRLTPSEREEAVRKVLAGESTINSVARALGVDHAAISYHVKKARNAAPAC